MSSHLENLKKEFREKFAKIDTEKVLEDIRIEFLGRKKGKLTNVLRSLKNLSLEEKRKIGPLVNSFRKELKDLIEQKKQALSFKSRISSSGSLDFTRPGEKIKKGHLHILTQVEREIKKIFLSLNFSVVEGPEIEDEFHNFDALNIPSEHPAREAWDTLWLKRGKLSQDKRLMRTHTSPVQIRYMKTHFPGFRVICPGRVFRHEAIDSCHQINFHQVEGLVVDKDINFSNFKYIIVEFLEKFFGNKAEMRFRPSYFPFTEPSVEIDIKLGQDWLEIMGAGMVHQNVFKAVGYNPKNWQGFAFGLGLERMAMLKYKIPDIRLFYENDLRFVEQF